MSKAPLMPMATALWLVENTTLTFRQIAQFCHLHEVEVQGIADGEVAKGIKAYNPIITGQLSREEIELSSQDQSRPLNIKNIDVFATSISKEKSLKKKFKFNRFLIKSTHLKKRYDLIINASSAGMSKKIKLTDTF